MIHHNTQILFSHSCTQLCDFSLDSGTLVDTYVLMHFHDKTWTFGLVVTFLKKNNTWKICQYYKKEYKHGKDVDLVFQSNH